jgi:hypothetical protein
MDNINVANKIMRDIREIYLSPGDGGYIITEAGLSAIRDYLRQSWQAGWDYRDLAGKNNNCNKQVIVYFNEKQVGICQSLRAACKKFAVPKSTALDSIRNNIPTKSGYSFKYE